MHKPCQDSLTLRVQPVTLRLLLLYGLDGCQGAGAGCVAQQNKHSGSSSVRGAWVQVLALVMWFPCLCVISKCLYSSACSDLRFLIYRMGQQSLFSVFHSQGHCEDQLHEEIKSACELKSVVKILLKTMANIDQTLPMCVFFEVSTLAAGTHNLRISVG